MATRFGIRMFIAAIVGTIALFCFGVGELWRCGRSLLGATHVPIADVEKNGLGSYGYVCITGVHADIDRCVIVMRKNRYSGAAGEWKGAYVPMLNAANPDKLATSPVLAWLPHARQNEDLFGTATIGLIDESEEGADDSTSESATPGGELTGFVKCSYDHLDPQEQKMLAPMARINSRSCWVVDVRRPSWLKGLGFLLGSIAIPGTFILWRMRNPGLD